ncbi:hypothetical protein CLPUN_06350 [Clostridium puniceum]|uniref:Uncharacterized protein n=1 Tax=Clostridium puniceum TaxID=29367 RepID=A0A1S8TW76_9CLOT|nr:hypothetical protein [Clostridium puniceum]OOM82017.1 hypothetical protein CLPUN_06350 [Clostridium puniceum]
MSEKYPQVLYAYVILLDNKIENWHVSFRNRNSLYEYSGYWKEDRLKDYKLQKCSGSAKMRKNVLRFLKY